MKFRIELRPQHGEQLGIMRHEWPIQVSSTKNHRISAGLEFNAATIMRFEQLPIFWSASQVDSQWRDGVARAAPADAEDPRETKIHQDGRFCFLCQQPGELDGAFTRRLR